MAVPLPGHRFVQFRYDPDYLRDRPDLRTENGVGLLNLPRCIRSDLIVDGGNVVRLRDTAILTNKVCVENPRYSQRNLRAKLANLLEVDRLILIPPEPEDVFGHSDGVLAFIDDRTLLVNDYRRVEPEYGKGLKSLLARHRFDLVPFPYCPTNRVIDGIASAEGCYINFLKTPDAIFLPAYGRREDDQATRILERAMPGRDIIPIRCNKLAEKGGVIHCVTWSPQEER